MMERLPQRFCPPSELGNPQRTRVSTFPQRRRLRLSNWTQLLNPRKSNVSTDSRPEPIIHKTWICAVEVRGDANDNVLYHSLLGLGTMQQVSGSVLRPSEARAFVNTCRLVRTNPSNHLPGESTVQGQKGTPGMESESGNGQGLGLLPATRDTRCDDLIHPLRETNDVFLQCFSDRSGTDAADLHHRSGSHRRGVARFTMVQSLHLGDLWPGD